MSSIRNKLSKKPVAQPTTTQPEPEKEAPKKEEEVKEEIKAKKYEFTFPDEINTFLADEKSYNDAKKEFLFEIIRDLYKKYKTLWAKPTIKQFFDDIYYKRYRI